MLGFRFYRKHLFLSDTFSMFLANWLYPRIKSNLNYIKSELFFKLQELFFSITLGKMFFLHMNCYKVLVYLGRFSKIILNLLLTLLTPFPPNGLLMLSGDMVDFPQTRPSCCFMDNLMG